MEKIKQNKLHTQTHDSFSRFKIFYRFLSYFNSIYTPDSYKNVEGVILRATFKRYRTCLFNAMLARKQPEDLADDCFQRCQDIAVD